MLAPCVIDQRCVQTTDSAPLPDYEQSDGSGFENYARFIRREMRPMIQKELEGLPDEEFRNRDCLLPRLVEMQCNVQSRLFDAYQQSPTSVYKQQPQSTEMESRASGIEAGITPPASATLTAFTPPPADGFADSPLSRDFEPQYFDVDSQELQRWRDGCVPPGHTVNDGEFV